MTTETVAAWVDRYVAAWESNDPAAIGGLFAANASYRQRPSDEPWQGRDAGWTHYITPPADYDNLWVLQFDDAGQCVDFTEWWMQPRDSSQTADS